MEIQRQDAYLKCVHSSQTTKAFIYNMVILSHCVMLIAWTNTSYVLNHLESGFCYRRLGGGGGGSLESVISFCSIIRALLYRHRYRWYTWHTSIKISIYLARPYFQMPNVKGTCVFARNTISEQAAAFLVIRVIHYSDWRTDGAGVLAGASLFFYNRKQTYRSHLFLTTRSHPATRSSAQPSRHITPI
jgi:hypothetical protein